MQQWYRFVQERIRKPARVIKTAVAAYYSSCHSGIDRSSQFRHNLSNDGFRFKWRQLVVVNCLRQLAMNSVIARRMVSTFSRDYVWTSLQAFRRDCSMKLPFRDGTNNLIFELIRWATRERRKRQSGATSSPASAKPRDWAGVRVPKRNRFKFFCKGIGKRMRLSEGLHGRIHAKSRGRSCVVCKAGGVSSVCRVCRVPLCIKRKSGSDQPSCFQRFHCAETLDTYDKHS